MADHGGHPADTGPSARSNAANTAGTGFSPETGTFIAANGSPFISIMDMAHGGAKVPDPANADRTCTATITARLNIPVVSDGDQGRLLLIMDADPLSQMPIWISRVKNEDTSTLAANTDADAFYFNEPDYGATAVTKDHCDPATWAQIWDRAGLNDFFATTKTLGELSHRHRVVGCAMRANIGVDTTLSRGTIEAGQFNWSESRFTSSHVEPTFTADLTGNLARQKYWIVDEPSVFSTASLSFKKQKGIGSLLQSCAYEVGKRTIRPARTQDIGVLNADQGASVRWTDSNAFSYMRTINRNIAMPSNFYYTNGVNDVSSPTAVSDEAGTNDVQFYNANYKRGGTTAFNTTGVRNKLALKKYLATGGINGSASNAYGSVYVCADGDSTLEVTSGTFVEGTSGYIGNSTFADLGVDTYQEHFDKGLYIDITGTATTQWVGVDLVWHIEYVPKSWGLVQGVASPIDLGFDSVAAMLRNPQHFPIVVKGHSFFSSLWQGLKKAVGFGRSVAQTTSAALSAAGAVNPELGMIGSEMASYLGVFDQSINALAPIAKRFNMG